MAYNYKTELERYRRYYQSLEPILGKPRSQSYTAVIFSFLVVSLFGLYAIRPTIQTILTLRREIQDKTDISQKMEDKIAALIEAQAAYNQVENSLPVIDQALPPDPDAVPLIIQLRNLANASGVTLSTIQMPTVPLLGKEATPTAQPQSAPAGPQRSFEFSGSIIGPYSGVLAFLSGLQEMRRIVTINSIAVTADKTTSPVASESATTIGEQLQLTMRLTSYYLVK